MMAWSLHAPDNRVLFPMGYSNGHQHRILRQLCLALFQQL